MIKLNNIEKQTIYSGSIMATIMIIGMIITAIGAIAYTVVNATNTYKVREKLDEEERKQVYYNPPIKATFNY